MRVLLPALIAAAVLGVAARPAPAQQLSFGSVRLDPLRELPMAQTFAPGPRWRLLQFQQSPNQQQRDALSAQGLRVVQYYPQNTYLAWGDAVAMQRSANVPGLRWAGDLQPDWKRSPDLHGRSGRIDNVQLLAAPVPEPDTWHMLLAGAAMLAGVLKVDGRRGARQR